MDKELSAAIERLTEQRWIGQLAGRVCADILLVTAAAKQASQDRRKADSEVLWWLANQEKYPHLSKAMLLVGPVERGEIEVKHE